MPLDLGPRLPPSQPDEIADSLQTQAKNIYHNMVNTFNRGSKMFWNNPNATPQQIAVSLGSNAKELFELHYKLGQLISTVSPTDILPGTSVIGQFTMNDDGTVTIIQPTPEPTSTPEPTPEP
jgi:hypothetical protein